MSTTEHTNDTLKWASWAAISMPFAFLLLALLARVAYPGPAYQPLFTAAIRAELFAPVLGLILGGMAWKSRLGRVAVALNALAIGGNLLWLFVIVPHALNHSKLF